MIPRGLIGGIVIIRQVVEQGKGVSRGERLLR